MVTFKEQFIFHLLNLLLITNHEQLTIFMQKEKKR